MKHIKNELNMFRCVRSSSRAPSRRCPTGHRPGPRAQRYIDAVDQKHIFHFRDQDGTISAHGVGVTVMCADSTR